MRRVEGIVLAAGASTRMGPFKMELPIGSKTLIESAIEGLSRAAGRIIVVGGHSIEKLRRVFAAYDAVEIVANARYREGMFTSVKAGVEHVGGDCFFVLPGDCPLVTESTFLRLLEAEGEIVIPVYEGRKGHPVLLGSRLAADILREPDNSSLRDFIRARDFTVVEVDDEGVTMDVDTPEDYEKVKDLHERRVSGLR
jgi:molybdenum cofactor cytidylyltransferase